MSGRVKATAGIALCFVLALAFGGCGSDAEQQVLDQASIEATLQEFLPVLGRVYSDGDVEALRPYAAEKELARIHALVEGLADQGRYLDPDFKQLTIEEAKTWNNSNAFVTTLEVWDVRMRALGSGEMLAEDVEKNYRVQYQLKRQDGGWRVLFRAIQE